MPVIARRHTHAIRRLRAHERTDTRRSSTRSPYIRCSTASQQAVAAHIRDGAIRRACRCSTARAASTHTESGVAGLPADAQQEAAMPDGQPGRAPRAT